jgi:hypothetical protein
MVSAQERVIEKSEFEALVAEGSNHHIRWKGEKHRMTVTTSSKVPGRSQTDWSSKMIFEYGPAKEIRTVTTSSFGGNAVPRKESLKLDNWVYTRTGNDPWTRKEYVSAGAAKDGEESTLKILKSQEEYRYLGPVRLIDVPVDVYVKTERQTKYNQKNGEKAENDIKVTYWIDAKGTILKSEFRGENRGTITSQTSVITEWMLDPSITFTAPEMVP